MDTTLLAKPALVGLALMFNASAAWAVPITDLLGDIDCFGSGAVCTEGATLPGGPGAVTSGGSDPGFSDRVSSRTATDTSWTHTFAAGAYTSASLTIRTVGIADVAGPYDVLVDGSIVGVMPFDGFSHFLVETFVFSVAPALVADGTALVSFAPDSGDGWAIDYSELTLEMAVSEPTSLALVALGIAGLRRRKSS